jgi:hypothetical protein
LRGRQLVAARSSAGQLADAGASADADTNPDANGVHDDTAGARLAVRERQLVATSVSRLASMAFHGRAGIARPWKARHTVKFVPTPVDNRVDQLVSAVRCQFGAESIHTPEVCAE